MDPKSERKRLSRCRSHCLNSRFFCPPAHSAICGVGLWARRSPPARKLSSSPLPSLHSNGSLSLSLSGSPFSFSFSFSYFVLVLHVRGIIFAKDAADPLAHSRPQARSQKSRNSADVRRKSSRAPTNVQRLSEMLPNNARLAACEKHSVA